MRRYLIVDVKYKRQPRRSRKDKPLLADKSEVISVGQVNASETEADGELGWPPSHGEVNIYLDPAWIERESIKQSWYCQSLAWTHTDSNQQTFIEKTHGHRIKGA